MPIRGFDHLAITVADMERSVAFYTDLLGAQTLFLEQFRHENFTVVSLIVGGNRINLHPTPPRTPPHLTALRPTAGSVDLCFRWDGPIDEVVTLLTERGLPIVEGPVPRPSADGQAATSVYCRDPDGNLLEFLTTDEN
jgi:catechol 2,3-dioxygenase-like lactoylglutathione lyase family enzyme